jgi:hypothetical protein
VGLRHADASASGADLYDGSTAMTLTAVGDGELEPGRSSGSSCVREIYPRGISQVAP